MRPNTCNSLPDNLKSANSANSFKYYIKEYFLSNLGDLEADNYSHLSMDPKREICSLFRIHAE